MAAAATPGAVLGAVGGGTLGTLAAMHHPTAGSVRGPLMQAGGTIAGLTAGGLGAGHLMARYNRRNNPDLYTQKTKEAFWSPKRGMPFDINVKYLTRQGQKGTAIAKKDEKEKEAGIGSALRSGGAKIMSAGRRLAAPPAPKIGLISSTLGGAATGALGGAAHGAMNAQPGQNRFDAARQGAKAGAGLGAVGGLGYRHVGNKVLKAQHARKMARL